MKKTIPSIVLLLIIGLTNARATGGVKNETATSKKSPAVVHNILSDQLPTRLLTGIKRNYKNYWISDLYRKTVNGRASYCITVENADKKVTLNATPSTTWFVTRIISKEEVTR
jgi:uncharacterized alpha/beta hydrolase family protein